MKSKSIIIVVAIVIGIITIVGITILAVHTANASAPRVLDLSKENVTEQENSDTQESQEKNDENDEEPTDEEENDESNEEETSNGLEDVARETFNNKFEMYEGDNVKGRNVNALLQTIRVNNEADKDHQVKAMADVQNWDSENNKADTNSKYKVYTEKDEDTGYITVVKIKDAD